jgi:hypothetical protein
LTRIGILVPEEVGDTTHFDRKTQTYLHVFQSVLLAYASKNVLLAALLHLSGQQQLIEDKVGLLEVEDDVELADIAVVLVHLFDESVYDFERNEFVVSRVTAGDEKEGGVSPVDDFGVLIMMHQ